MVNQTIWHDRITGQLPGIQRYFHHPLLGAFGMALRKIQKATIAGRPFSDC